MNITQTDTNIQEITNFFSLLYGQGAPGYLTVWDKQEKKTRWFSTLQQAAQAAFNLSADKDMYFGIGLRGQQLGPNKRGSESDIIAIPCLWLDVDYDSPAHALGRWGDKKTLPPDQYAALELVNRFPLPYSILIHSGHGLYPLWLFKKLWVIRKDESPLKESEDRRKAKELAGKFDAVIDHFFEEAGYHLVQLHIK